MRRRTRRRLVRLEASLRPKIEKTAAADGGSKAESALLLGVRSWGSLAGDHWLGMLALTNGHPGCWARHHGGPAQPATRSPCCTLRPGSV